MKILIFYGRSIKKNICTLRNNFFKKDFSDYLNACCVFGHLNDLICCSLNEISRRFCLRIVKMNGSKYSVSFRDKEFRRMLSIGEILGLPWPSLGQLLRGLDSSGLIFQGVAYYIKKAERFARSPLKRQFNKLN